MEFTRSYAGCHRGGTGRIDNGPMMSLRALIQLAKIYQDLDPKVMAALDALGTDAGSAAVDHLASENTKDMENLEQWLQIASLEGVRGSGKMAQGIRNHLYPCTGLSKGKKTNERAIGCPEEA